MALLVAIVCVCLGIFGSSLEELRGTKKLGVFFKRTHSKVED